MMIIEDILGTFSGKGYYRGTIYKFNYKVDDSSYIADTRFELYDKYLNNLKLVVKYSKKMGRTFRVNCRDCS